MDFYYFDHPDRSCFYQY